jgi:hypothetical protein
MAEHCYAECHLCILSLMLSVTYKLMLSVFMLNVVMQSVIMPSAIAPAGTYSQSCFKCVLVNVLHNSETQFFS